MTGVEVEQAILEQWESGWEQLHPADPDDPDYVPWTPRNEDFDLSELGALGAWARITILPTTSEQVTHGGEGDRKYEDRGNVIVQLFAAVNHVSGAVVLDGNATVKALVDDVVSVLRGKRLGGVNLYAATPTALPENGGWNAYAVTIPYRTTQLG